MTSDLKLERMLLDEIPIDDAERARLEELRRESEQILAAHPPAGVVAEVERRARVQVVLQKNPKQTYRILVPSLAVALSSALVLIAIRPDLEETRSKGHAELLIHRKAGDHADRLHDGDLVKAGDVLQVSYLSGGHPYGVIFSIDGAGVVTLHHPASNRAVPELSTEEKAVPLPTAYELDDAPRYERFFFVTSDQPLDVGTIMEAARAGTKLEREEIEVFSVILQKGSP